VFGMTANNQQIRQEMDAAIEKLERQKESLVQRSMQVEKDLQLRIQQERNAHDEDTERMTREQVSYMIHYR
jgi:hypothetical protein